MILPWLAALAVEWPVLRRYFAPKLGRAHASCERGAGSPAIPTFPLAVLALTLIGFGLSSVLGVAPLWIAVAGAMMLNAPALFRRRATIRTVDRSAQPAFLVFVLGLAVIVRAASMLGTGPVLAVLIGVNLGPNLTYVGSLATLLWRRVLHSHQVDVSLRELTILGVLTVPVGIVAATTLLWLVL